jgi:hypothetical protein
MPTVKGISGPYRFFFYSFDCNEPATSTSNANEWSASSGFSLWPLRRTMGFQLVNSDEFGRILWST